LLPFRPPLWTTSVKRMAHGSCDGHTARIDISLSMLSLATVPVS
jgi:hypothetical protein